MYTLDGRQKKALHAALRHAFPRHAALERLVEFHLDESLAVIAGDGPLDDVIFRVIAWAEAQGRLDALVNGARQEAPGNPRLATFERLVVEARDAGPADAALATFAERVRLAPTVPPDVDLEKRVFRAGFSDVAHWRARLAQAERAVCRLEAPAWRAIGTGFLVGPDLVMTNRHVVEAVGAGKGSTVVARFDFAVSPDGTRLREGETFGLAADWLVVSSPVERLDFAIVRLRTSAGLGATGGTPDAPPRGWVTPQWREPEADETIFVLQHPQGEALKIAAGRFDRREGDRLQYRVDTEPGSSGSPCFTAQLELIGLHRGSSEGLANQGVPFDSIARVVPAGLLTPPAQDVRRASTPEAAVEPAVGAPGRGEALTPRARWHLARIAAAVVIAVLAAAVPLWWWTRSPTRQGEPARSGSRVEQRQSGPRRVAREVQVPFDVGRVEGEGCAPTPERSRAMFRLVTRTPWPGTDPSRGRELQLVALDGLEIEEASAAVRGGAEAAVVAQAQRRVSRRWLFPEPITAPVVVIACVRTSDRRPPLPTFRLTSWKEIP